MKEEIENLTISSSKVSTVKQQFVKDFNPSLVIFQVESNLVIVFSEG